MFKSSIVAGILAATTLIGISSVAEARLENRPAMSTPQAPVTSVAMTLVFSARVDLSASSVVITDAAGNRVSTGDLRFGQDSKNVEIPLTAPLKPGVYSINWHAVSTDGQNSVGGYDFTIDPVGRQTPFVAQQ